MKSFNKLALGTVQFGLNYGVANALGRVGNDQVAMILNRALECGFDTLDTAVSYGISENVLGKLGVHQWKVVSKLPSIPNGCNDVYSWVSSQTINSLSLLKLDRLHGMLLHRPEQLLGPYGNSLYKALQRIKAEGLVDKIGVSVYGLSQLEQLIGEYKFDLVQAPLNILDRSLIDSGWAMRLHEMGIEVHTRSAFLQGLLLMPANIRPEKFMPWAQVWAEWDGWLERTGLQPLEACIRFLCSVSQVDRVVVGVDSLHQLNQIVDAIDGSLVSLPEFKTFRDLRLINPSKWNQL